MEEMAESADEDVVNLLWMAILEPLVFSRERMSRGWGLMGSRTKELARELAELRGWRDNIPHDDNHKSSQA